MEEKTPEKKSFVEKKRKKHKDDSVEIEWDEWGEEETNSQPKKSTEGLVTLIPVDITLEMQME